MNKSGTKYMIVWIFGIIIVIIVGLFTYNALIQFFEAGKESLAVKAFSDFLEPIRKVCSEDVNAAFSSNINLAVTGKLFAIIQVYVPRGEGLLSIHSNGFITYNQPPLSKCEGSSCFCLVRLEETDQDYAGKCFVTMGGTGGWSGILATLAPLGITSTTGEQVAAAATQGVGCPHWYYEGLDMLQTIMGQLSTGQRFTFAFPEFWGGCFMNNDIDGIKWGLGGYSNYVPARICGQFQQPHCECWSETGDCGTDLTWNDIHCTSSTGVMLSSEVVRGHMDIPHVLMEPIVGAVTQKLTSWVLKGIFKGISGAVGKIKEWLMDKEMEVLEKTGEAADEASEQLETMDDSTKNLIEALARDKDLATEIASATEGTTSALQGKVANFIETQALAAQETAFSQVLGETGDLSKAAQAGEEAYQNIITDFTLEVERITETGKFAELIKRIEIENPAELMENNPITKGIDQGSWERGVQQGMRNVINEIEAAGVIGAGESVVSRAGLFVENLAAEVAEQMPELLGQVVGRRMASLYSKLSDAAASTAAKRLEKTMAEAAARKLGSFVDKAKTGVKNWFVDELKYMSYVSLAYTYNEMTYEQIRQLHQRLAISTRFDKESPGIVSLFVGPSTIGSEQFNIPFPFTFLGGLVNTVKAYYDFLSACVTGWMGDFGAKLRCDAAGIQLGYAREVNWGNVYMPILDSQMLFQRRDKIQFIQCMRLDELGCNNCDPYFDQNCAVKTAEQRTCGLEVDAISMWDFMSWFRYHDCIYGSDVDSKDMSLCYNMRCLTFGCDDCGGYAEPPLCDAFQQIAAKEGEFPCTDGLDNDFDGEVDEIIPWRNEDGEINEIVTPYQLRNFQYWIGGRDTWGLFGASSSIMYMKVEKACADCKKPPCPDYLCNGELTTCVDMDPWEFDYNSEIDLDSDGVFGEMGDGFFSIGPDEYLMIYNKDKFETCLAPCETAFEACLGPCDTNLETCMTPCNSDRDNCLADCETAEFKTLCLDRCENNFKICKRICDFKYDTCRGPCDRTQVSCKDVCMSDEKKEIRERCVNICKEHPIGYDTDDDEIVDFCTDDDDQDGILDKDDFMLVITQNGILD